eukprot:CAMPEP_0115101952 /NCGR_PEP_ID=MMETSP0227-20121206/33569_1 /TAXON_ID=89957 /ORGANISM="Polarella glacialis, Strain CCMP 1383" /LENGTH=149 /DNA_ID=CAMNT_0002497863 /DNA_START=303 /DNA_END=750 /DNA_ORIENTATION=+
MGTLSPPSVPIDSGSGSCRILSAGSGRMNESDARGTLLPILSLQLKFPTPGGANADPGAREGAGCVHRVCLVDGVLAELPQPTPCSVLGAAAWAVEGKFAEPVAGSMVVELAEPPDSAVEVWEPREARALLVVAQPHLEKPTAGGPARG